MDVVLAILESQIIYCQDRLQSLLEEPVNCPTCTQGVYMAVTEEAMRLKDLCETRDWWTKNQGELNDGKRTPDESS